MSLFSKEPRRHPGGFAPLFDRLVDEDPFEETEPKIKKFYQISELVESLQREIAVILSTRCNARHERYDALSKEGLKLSEVFGVPSLSALNPARQSDWTQIEAWCRKAIKDFEPRLTNIGVQVVGWDSPKQTLSLTIHADFICATYQESVNFPISFLPFKV